MKSQPETNADAGTAAPANAESTHQASAADAVTPHWVDFAAPRLSGGEGFFWLGGAGAQARPENPHEQARRQAAQGDALVAGGQLQAALARFHEAVWLCPDSAEFHYRLAGAAERAGDVKLLEQQLKEAVRLDPRFAPAHFALSKFHRAAGVIDKAMHHSAQAVALAPGNHRYVSEHAIALLMTGKPRPAFETIQPLIDAPGAVDRWIASVYARLAPMIGHEEQALAAVRRALEAEDLTNTRDGRPMLLFAAAGLLDRLGRYDEAFECADTAAKLARTTCRPHDAAEFSDWVTNKIKFFTRERFDSLPRATHGNRRPVFIVGLPRSGSTLLEQILHSHPAVFAAGELDALNHILQGQNDDWNEGEKYPYCLDSLSPKIANRLAANYLSVIESKDRNAAYVTDKMPVNLLGLELVELLFPGCHIIHCVRGPLDTCLSCYMTNFAISNEFAQDLGTMGAYYRDNRRLMEHWKTALETPILEVRYEDLVLDTQGQTRRVLEFLDLPWDEGCLRYWENRRSAGTASEDQVRKPIYTTSIGRWKHYEAHLGPLFAALGRPIPGERAESDAGGDAASAPSANS